MKYLTKILKVIFFSSLFSTASTNAAVITNGNLTVNVRDDNGAIDSYVLNGVDFFEQGTPVSDWGVQVDTSTSSFALNSTSGGENINVSVNSISANRVEVKGIYSAGGANVEIVRTLSIDPGFDALVFFYTLINLDSISPVKINVFETFDPDQGQVTGNGFGTYNDVFIQNGFAIGQAVDQTGLAFVIASGDPRVVIASGEPFQISNGVGLNNVIANPFDGEGGFADSGTHMVLVAELEASEITTSINVGAAFKGSDVTSIVGQPLSNGFITEVERVAGSGAIPPVVSLDDYIDSFDDGSGTLITTGTEKKESGAGSTGLFLMILLLFALFRKRI